MTQSSLSELLASLRPDERERILLEREALLTLKPEKLLRASPLNPHYRKYGHLTPTIRQAEFLKLECEEALYGGAAGGAKSEALLMWLSEGVENSEYGGVIFRRTWPQLARRDGLIDKSKKLFPHMGGRFRPGDKTWIFPSGATIELGHLPFQHSIEDYQGPSYHRIAFDELTQFPEPHYLFLMGRLRRNPNFPIRPGMRAASNPGGRGHLWVKSRFVTDEALRVMAGRPYREPSPPGAVFYATKDRAFVPARLADNPHLDFDDYVQKLMHLDPVTRERMLAGDWSVRDDARFDASWFRNWEQHYSSYKLYGAGGLDGGRLMDPADCERFITVDAAATSAEVRKLEKLGRRSRSVISVWDRHLSSNDLIWRDCRHGYWEFGRLISEIKLAWQDHRPSFIAIEDEKTGRAAHGMLYEDFPVKLVSHGARDKLARALPFIRHAEEGKVFLPLSSNWRTFAESEMLSWTGDPDEPADFIDTAAYAALHMKEDTGVLIFDFGD